MIGVNLGGQQWAWRSIKMKSVTLHPSGVEENLRNIAGDCELKIKK